MSKAIYIAIASVCGAALGGGIAYVYLNKRYGNVFDSEIEAYREEIDNLKKSNKDFQSRLADKLKDTKEAFFDKEKVVEVDDPDSLVIDEDDEDEGYDAEDTSKSNDIRFISLKDYEDDDDYEKEEFKYFMPDGVISQNNEILEDEEFIEVCGPTALKMLRKDKSLKSASGDDNKLYIRNEQYDTDYEITRYHTTYNQYMMDVKE